MIAFRLELHLGRFEGIVGREVNGDCMCGTMIVVKRDIAAGTIVSMYTYLTGTVFAWLLFCAGDGSPLSTATKAGSKGSDRCTVSLSDGPNGGKKDGRLVLAKGRCTETMENECTYGRRRRLSRVNQTTKS